MRFIIWLIGLPLAALFVLFALSNREMVELGVWPFQTRVEVGVYLAVLAPFLFGLILGWTLPGLTAWRQRGQLKSKARRIALLEQELTVAKNSVQRAQTELAQIKKSTEANPRALPPHPSLTKDATVQKP